MLCLTPRSGVADEFNVIFDQPAPGPLRDMAGVNVDDYTMLEGSLALEGIPGVQEAVTWADEIELAGEEPAAQEVMARFTSGWLKGKPAITVHPYGLGKVVYVGTLLRGTSLDAFTKWLVAIAGIEPVLHSLPKGVRAYERQGSRDGQGYRIVFLCNFTHEEQYVLLHDEWEDLLGKKNISRITMAPAGVAVLRKPLV